MKNKKPKRMKTAQLVKQMGSVRAVADALGLSRQAVHQWGEFVPVLREYQLREIIDREGGT